MRLNEMAILTPKLEEIRRKKVGPSEGEWTLLKFLADNLDNSYEIFYQPYLNGDNPDIAVVRKGSGVLLIEVKDWDLKNYHVDKRTNWHLSNGKIPVKSPLTQIDSYKSSLFNLHLKDLFEKSAANRNLWATVNCAVYFHYSKERNAKNLLLYDFQDKQYDSYRRFVNYMEILGYNSLHKKRLNSLLSKFWLNKTSHHFDDTLYNCFVRYLKPPIHQIEDGIEITYTKEQQEIIRSEVRPRRKIKGVAGSGKTLVLAQRAVNAYKRTNSRVLILTYNLSLKNYIHDRISDVREEFDWSYFYITNYHQFFKTQANNYNLEITEIGAWQDTEFFESVKDEIDKYDVVFIDEVQDYKQPWLDIITTYFIHSETEFVVFGDEKQNIYDRELDENNEPVVRTIPGAWNKSLNTSYRFASNIGNLAIQFQKAFLKDKYSIDDLKFMSQLDFEKRIVEYHYFQSFVPDTLFRSIYDVLEREQIHSSDVAILCSKIEILRDLDFSIRKNKHENTNISFESKEEHEANRRSNDRIEEIRRARKNHFYMKSGTIKLSTIYSFKGWEIDTLFFIVEKDDTENAELIYTGITRARKNLIIFNVENNRYDEFFRSKIDAVYEHK